MARKRFLERAFIFILSQADDMPSAFNALLTDGSCKKSCSFLSFWICAENAVRSFSTPYTATGGLTICRVDDDVEKRRAADIARCLPAMLKPMQRKETEFTGPNVLPRPKQI